MYTIVVSGSVKRKKEGSDIATPNALNSGTQLNSSSQHAYTLLCQRRENTTTAFTIVQV